MAEGSGLRVEGGSEAGSYLRLIDLPVGDGDDAENALVGLLLNSGVHRS